MIHLFTLRIIEYTGHCQMETSWLMILNEEELHPSWLKKSTVRSLHLQTCGVFHLPLSSLIQVDIFLEMHERAERSLAHSRCVVFSMASTLLVWSPPLLISETGLGGFAFDRDRVRARGLAEVRDLLHYNLLRQVFTTLQGFHRIHTSVR